MKAAILKPQVSLRMGECPNVGLKRGRRKQNSTGRFFDCS